MEQLISDIESNELRQYERQARDAAEKASTPLRGEFINALTARIGKMRSWRCRLTAVNLSPDVRRSVAGANAIQSSAFRKLLRIRTAH
ncbi:MULTISPECIES: hypothetical protein [Bradyrhizobium]|uniref:hypothetical protein n=1 Tax=Bradyrhizobium TaxID=374 RepID=UPI001008A1F2|nr:MULTISPECIES: hypothetical protein [Bradyrhizobium]